MPLNLRRHYLLVFALALGLSTLVQRPIAMAAAVEAEDVVSPLIATPLTSPNPVLGADDKVHLAYEIVLVNMAPADIGLKRWRRSMPQAVPCSARWKATRWRRCSSSMAATRELRFPAAAPAFCSWM